jgi:hypothetical protein
VAKAKRARRTQPKRPKRPKIVALHARDNIAIAQAIAAHAQHVAEEGRSVIGYAVVTVCADGSAQASHGARNELALIGAIEAAKRGIMADWR